MSEIEKLLLEGHEKMFNKTDAILRELNDIKVQTTKTNGRVTRLEEKHLDCPIHDPKTKDVLAKIANPEQALKSTVFDSIKFLAQTAFSVLAAYLFIKGFKL